MNTKHLSSIRVIRIPIHAYMSVSMWERLSKMKARTLGPAENVRR